MRKFEQLSYEELEILDEIFKSYGPLSYSNWNVYANLVKEIRDEKELRG
jgi:hypothetical protein